MDIKSAIASLVEGKDLSKSEMYAVMKSIMTGETTAAQIGAFLVALRIKGESIDEIVGAVEVMRELATPVSIQSEYLVDTCGTGGDGANLFNVSTAAAFVVAAAGAQVAKHGNRSVSSSTGSADLLEKAGVNLNIPADQVARAVQEIGVGFMFAPAHHGAMKYAIGPRKELGMRTIFNMLGPMTNPASVKRQVIGVFSRDVAKPMAEVLRQLGSEHVLVVHSEDGLDEFSVSARTFVVELKAGVISEYAVSPSGYNYDNLDGLSVNSSEESLALIQKAFSDDESDEVVKARDMITLNAGAAIYVSGLALDLASGVEMAEDALSTGLAKEKLKELIEFTNC